ncbi:hypothetical protein JW906_12580 [bacterium]|nr:hypothetical protein [bacterium]
MKELRLLVISVVFSGLLLTARHGMAETGRAGSAGSFLSMGLGGQAMGIGGGSVSFAEDGHIAKYNPAGLVFLPGRWATATLHVMALDRRMHYIGIAMPLGPEFDKVRRGNLRAGFALGWQGAGVEKIDGRDSDGKPTGLLSNQENAFFFSFAVQPARIFSFGISGKLLYNRFPGITSEGEALSATGFGFDLGLFVRPHQRLALGFALRDLRGRYTWNSQKLYERGSQTVDEFMPAWQAGAAVEGIPGRLTLFADMKQMKGRPLEWAAGLSISPLCGIFFRTGFSGSVLSAGLGLRWRVYGRMACLDYALAPDPVAPSANHVFSWSLIF